jgi:hypothetical protein
MNLNVPRGPKQIAAWVVMLAACLLVAYIFPWYVEIPFNLTIGVGLGAWTRQQQKE